MLRHNYKYLTFDELTRFAMGCFTVNLLVGANKEYASYVSEFEFRRRNKFVHLCNRVIDYIIRF